MKMARAAAPAMDQLSAFIELAKDPTAFAAHLKTLQDLEISANAATAEAKQRRTELNETENALNLRAADIETQASKLRGDAEALSVRTAAFEETSARRRAEMNKRGSAQDTREQSQNERETAVSEMESKTGAFNRQAQMDRATASALLSQLKAVVSGLDSLKAQIAALG